MDIQWATIWMILTILLLNSATSERLEIEHLKSNQATVVRCLPVELECRVSSLEASIWWTLNGRNVSGEYADAVMERRDRTSILKISCPQLNHSGQFTCHAVLNNDAESYVNESLTFNVYELQTPLSQFIRMYSKPLEVAKKDEEVQLQCFAEAGNTTWDAVDLRWEKNGLEINKHFLTRRLDKHRWELTLVIQRFSLADAGRYTCKAGLNWEPWSTNTTLIASSSLAPANVKLTMVNSNNPGSLVVHWPKIRLESVRVQFYYLNVSYIDQVVTRNVSVFHNSGSFNDQLMMEMWQPPLENTFYTFTVTACLSDKICGDPSPPALLTYFRNFNRPENVAVECRHDNISLETFLYVTWKPPLMSLPLPSDLAYQVKVYGQSQFRNSNGDMKLDVEDQTYTSSYLVWRQRMISNTNYTVQVCVQTAFGCGNYSLQSSTTRCSTPPSVPKEIPSLELRNVAAHDCACLVLDLSRVSERSGSIRCYRVILYKLKEGQIDVPDSASLTIASYREVHSEQGYGAYVAESFSSENFKEKVVLGDELQSQCSFELEGNSSLKRYRRNDESETDELTDKEENIVTSQTYDGKLNPGGVYSGFIEVIVDGSSGRELKRRSKMFPSVQIVSQDTEPAALPTALGVICGLVAIILILIVALCLLRRKNMERLPRDAPILPQPNMKPIRKDSLVAAYLERHKDSDLLFQREYEMLPEYFKDRSSKASDNSDNIYKNRYPDIKAYDQTRVKLKPIPGLSGSDYINANYVPGYKNRKKFICAQGPLEKTINDFWKMIWEQRVEVIAMVTGLEENGKSKCAKYWPNSGDLNYGDIVVSLNNECTYDDYSVRKLVVKMAQNFDSSEPLTVTQLHFTAWRDFLAPDRPGGILKFMKKIQEIWKLPTSSPLLVHCSAGVGRSGTLIAIDILMEQLEEEGEINIYQTVAELRRHRNFMVQSLTQYIFIYRAVMESHQFGYTEVALDRFSAQLEELENGGEGNSSLLQAEFHKLDEVVEDHKSTDVGSLELNAAKNRYEYILPFDKNRVVLTSIPNEDASTYINASAVAGSDRSTAYILTQDPLETTRGDFWRMMYEQSVGAIVMLSQSVGNASKEQCPVYWPENKESLVFKHISVRLVEEEEENGERIKRKFVVTNMLNSKEVAVTQFHCKNWDSNLPESPSLILKLIEEVLKVIEDDGRKNPIVVHCTNGGERSSLFTAVCILVRQAKKEKRVDVFHTICSLRSERQLMIPTLDHYHFCYKAILEYAKSEQTYE